MIKIRKLKKSDWPLFQSFFKTVVNSDFLEFPQKTRQYLTSKKYARDRLFKAGLTLGAFDGKKLAGILIGATPFAGVLSIAWLAVSEKYQKKGIGKELLKECEAYAKDAGIHNIQIAILPQNLAFYKKCGYKKFGFDEKSYFGISVYLVKKLISTPKESQFLRGL